MSVIDDVVAALVAQELGQITNENADWFIRTGFIQATPDRSICVYAAGGPPPETGIPVDYPNIQVRVRGKINDYNAVQIKEAAVYSFLHAGDATFNIGENYVYCYAMQSAPIPMGQDENKRPALVRNYRMMVRRDDPDDF